MKRIFFISFFLSISLIGFSQNYNEALNRLIYKTSKQDRDLIKKFVLSEGELRYYNEFYGDCPFYQFNDIDVYLLPVDSIIYQIDEYKRYQNSEYDKYGIYLEYNEDERNKVKQNSTTISISSDIRSDINYILKIVKEKYPL